MDQHLLEQHGHILAQNVCEENEPNDEASWVMLKQNGDIEPLPHEKIIVKTRKDARLALEITPPKTTTQPATQFSLKSERGTAYITTNRIIYLPQQPTGDLKSFAAPILNCEDSHVSSSFFGPWYWESTVKPVPDGGIPAEYPRVTLRLIFRDGGHDQFQTKFEAMKENLHNAIHVASSVGQTNILSSVHGEQLPQYEAATSGDPAQNAARDIQPDAPREAQQQNVDPPDEPPPGYDEAQAQAINMRLDEHIRREADRG